MNDIFFSIVGFIVCTIAIVYSGVKLTKYGDAIAEITGWGKAWTGLILMASVTSLPELMTGISSVVIIDEPDLAAGDVFGSCIFNLLILSYVDARIGKPLTSIIKTTHLFAVLFSMILLAISALAILTSGSTPILFWLSPFSILIVLIYLLAVYVIYKNDVHTGSDYSEHVTDAASKSTQLRSILWMYALSAFFVIVAAAFLPYFGDDIAKQTSMSNTFFGTLFLAASTSLPEFVVSIAAIRIASYDLLVGNLLGSNIFNILILSLDDVFYTRGSLYKAISPEHVETVIVVVLMTAVMGLGILAKPVKKYWKFSFDTFTILLLYIGLMTFLYFSQ